MIPLFPKGGVGFSGTNPQSSITVAYDDVFRIFITSTEETQKQLREELGFTPTITPLPPRDAVAAYRMTRGGRAAAGGARQERAYTRYLQ